MATSKRRVIKNKIGKGEEACWLWQEKCLETIPEGMFGFIYLITNKLDGRIYVGKKQFTHKKRTVLSKKARVGTRKRINVSQIDSGWKNYWGSSKSLLEDIKQLGQHNFSKEVLMFCTNKSQLSYYEVVNQIGYKVLERPSYNGWISCKIYKNKL